MSKHRPYEEVGVRKGQLKNGDHIYVLRKKICGVTIPSFFNWYFFSHHGIYDSEQNSVIHFAKGGDVVFYEDDDDDDEDESGVIQAASARVGQLINAGEKNRIGYATGKLHDFQVNPAKPDDKDDVDGDQDEKMLFFRYSYGCDPEKSPGTEGTRVEARSVDGTEADRKAVEIARWFSREKNHRLFGKYKLADWNCEYFATFCKTFTLEVSDLDRFLSNPPDEDPEFQLRDGCIPREFLKKYSQATSEQTSWPLHFQELLAQVNANKLSTVLAAVIVPLSLALFQFLFS